MAACPIQLLITKPGKHMMRNKTPLLIQSRIRQKGTRFHARPQQTLVHQPWWFEQYYEHKQNLATIRNNNRNIDLLAKNYQVNPSVYALQQVEAAITRNCQLIESVDGWASRFRYSPRGTEAYKNEKNMVSHFQDLLSQQIMSLFNSKQIISAVNSDVDHASHYGHVSPNNSFSQPPNVVNSFQSNDRNRVFQEVSSKIENLNVLLRRMNAVVVGQGDLVNRIDQNLTEGKQNMQKANEQLQRRVQKQEGSGEFSCEGRVNKVITTLYFVNLAIILMFVLKHLIF